MKPINAPTDSGAARGLVCTKSAVFIVSSLRCRVVTCVPLDDCIVASLASCLFLIFCAAVSARVSVFSHRSCHPGSARPVGVRSRAERAACASASCGLGAEDRGRAVRDAWPPGAVAPRGDCPVMYILCAL